LEGSSNKDSSVKYSDILLETVQWIGRCSPLKKLY